MARIRGPWCEDCDEPASFRCRERGHEVTGHPADAEAEALRDLERHLPGAGKRPETPAERPETGLECPTCTPGALEASVRADLARLGPLTSGTRGALASMAIILARTIDGGGLEPPTPAQVAQLSQQLRATLSALTSGGGQDGTIGEQLAALLSAPVGDTEDPFPADDGSTRRADSRRPRKAPDALAAARSERGPGDDRR